jgi:sugar/nucleoside kinase (ribokinase family)
MPRSLPLPPADAKRFDVVAFGENSLDVVGELTERLMPDSGGKQPLATFDMLPGGQAATFAVGCARQGCRARYVGVFGADAAGHRVRDALAREGVDVVALERLTAPSRTAIVLVDPDGERRVLEHRHPALGVEPGELPLEALLSGRLLMVDATLGPASIAAARNARAAGIPTLVDVDATREGWRELVAQIDVLIVPDRFVQSASGRTDIGEGLLELQRAFDPAVLIATMHAEGSIGLVDGRLVRSPGFATSAVDTTGAGDAFRAGFASAWVRLGETTPFELLLAHANATAALNCRAMGAQRGLPSWGAVEALCNARGSAAV